MRGALGTILRELNCDNTCPGARICERRASCQYARIFEPVDWQDGPAHLDGVTVRAGQSFHFDVHLFMTRERPPIETFVDAFSGLADTGLGPPRGRVRLEDTATN